MPVINTLSTKSPAVWQTTIRPSKLFALFYFSIFAVSLLAALLCPIAIGFKAALMFLVSWGTWRNYQTINRTTELFWLDDNQWKVNQQSSSHSGYTASGCFRCGFVIVIAIAPAKGLTKHVMIWRDSVSAVDFSWLQIRLALTASHQLH